jgi:hypothetical protein
MGAASKVFDAELWAIFECLMTCYKYIRLNYLPHYSIHLFTINQSTIICSSCLSSGLGQDLAHVINDITLKLNTVNTQVTIYWVLGHTDISMNDEADCLAKMATTLPPMIPLPTSLL